MIRHVLHALLAILLVSVVTAQARLDGVWQGETAGGRALTLTLAVKADTLTGTLTRDQETTTITDGNNGMTSKPCVACIVSSRTSVFHSPRTSGGM